MSPKTPLAQFLCVALGACGANDTSQGAAGSGGSSANAVGSQESSASTGTNGTGGLSKLAVLLQELNENTSKALQTQGSQGGWPAPVEDGYLVVSTNLAQTNVAGDFSDWQPTNMALGKGFRWAVVKAAPASRYKFTDGAKNWNADPWSRVYGYDDNGEMSFLQGSSDAHLERHFAVEGAGLGPRTVRIWLPKLKATRVLYVQDGQNLFDPEAPWGGWNLASVAPSGVMLVGIDNSAARMDEYTHVPDDLGDGPTGGHADAYAAFLNGTVRSLIAARYGEPAIVGVMGSSLGGLVSLAVADSAPGQYAFAASLSGTLGWGSIGAGVHNETMLQRYQQHGHRKTVLYVDAGGGGTCADSDLDGTDDDGDGSDNFCENFQFTKGLGKLGYTEGKDLFTFHEPGAPHNEAAWAARVFHPLDVFATIPTP